MANSIVVSISYLLAILACVLAAFLLLKDGHKEWYWFLGAAVLFGGGLAYSNQYGYD